jgi:hypothetical protein
MSVSLATLLTNTRDYLDESSASRWSEAELTRYVNQGLSQVQSQIQAANEDYFLRVEVATAAAGSYELAFPSNIWGNKLRAVYCYLDSTTASGKPYKVPPASLESVYDNLNSSGTPAGYTMHAGYLRWAPLLESTSTFRFIYALKETALSATGQNIAQIADEHTDCISLYAGIMARQKVGAPTKELADMYKLRMNQILNDVQPSDPPVFGQVSIDD